MAMAASLVKTLLMRFLSTSKAGYNEAMLVAKKCKPERHPDVCKPLAWLLGGRHTYTVKFMITEES